MDHKQKADWSFSISCLVWFLTTPALWIHMWLKYVWLTYGFFCSMLLADHSLWSGELPGQTSGVYLSLPEHYGVWRQQHPLSQGGVRSVSQKMCQNPCIFKNVLKNLGIKKNIGTYLESACDSPVKSCSLKKKFLVLKKWKFCACECVLFFDSWAGYEHSSFCGQQFVLERGEYPHWESWSGSNAYHIERMMSFRPICSAVHF